MLDTRLFEPTYRGKYPHMFPRDIEVWERFLDKYGELYKGFYYDVLCGNHAELPVDYDIKYAMDAYLLSKLRIDALGVRDESYDLIEVKPRATAGAIGQLLNYKDHFEKEYEPDKPVRMLLVASEIDANIIPLTEKHHIIYIIV